MVRYCLFIFLLSTISLQSLSQKKITSDKLYWYKRNIKESDGVMKLEIIDYVTDSCKNCVSEGKLYIVKSRVLHTYLNKKQKNDINRPFYFMASGAEVMILEKKPKYIIAFLEYHDPKGKRFYMPAVTPNVYWYMSLGIMDNSPDVSAIEKIFKNKR